jgi:hypothetical protein
MVDEARLLNPTPWTMPLYPNHQFVTELQRQIGMPHNLDGSHLRLSPKPGKETIVESLDVFMRGPNRHGDSLTFQE